eukprot:14471771-Ditylum_brightwellii.AAC.1
MQIIGKGTVHYYVNDDHGNKVQILISNAYHIPSLPVRLTSPQQLAQQPRDPLTGAYATKKDLILSWDFHCTTLKYNKANNLHMLYTEPGGSTAASMLTQHKDPFPSMYANRHALPFSSLLEEDNTPHKKMKWNQQTTCKQKYTNNQNLKKNHIQITTSNANPIIWMIQSLLTTFPHHPKSYYPGTTD